MNEATRAFFIYFWCGACAGFTTVGSAVAAPTNQYLSFDGIDYVEFAQSDSLNLSSGAFTISAWVHVKGGGTTDQATFIDHGVSTGDGSAWNFGIDNQDTNGTLRFESNDGSGVVVRSFDGAVTLNTWHYVAVTAQDSTLRFFVDGIERGSFSGVPLPLPHSAPVRIGARVAGDADGLVGDLDEVRIWNRALAPEEIRAGMLRELSGNEPSLLSYFDFNENLGQTATNRAPFGSDAQLGSTGGADPQDPLWQPEEPRTNAAPQIEAGPTRYVAVPDGRLVLDATVTDDGLPAPMLAYLWTVSSGPAAVEFTDSTTHNTTAQFTTPGHYTLRITASDSDLSSFDELDLTVYTNPTLTRVEVLPNPGDVPAGETLQLHAIGRDQHDRELQINPAWTATGGSISNDGLFLADQLDGAIEVSAAASGIAGVADVYVGETAARWPTNGWKTISADQAGMDETLLHMARDYALTGGGSGFVTRRGKLVLSWGDVDESYDIKSSTKSIGALLLGAAIGDGLVSLNDFGQTHLSELGQIPAENQQTGWLDDITILQLGTHTAGFDRSGNENELKFEPGTTWSYSDSGANWLADLLTVVLQSDLSATLSHRLLTPLGIPSSAVHWRSNSYRSQFVHGYVRREIGSGISTSVQVMARLGYLALRRGEWDGVQLLPSDYIDQMSASVPSVQGLPVNDPSKQQGPNASNHYGILWWNNADGTMAHVPTDTFWAWGLHDSLTIVIPSLEIVATRAGQTIPGDRRPDAYRVIEPFIQPIVQSVETFTNDRPTVDAGSAQVVEPPDSAVLLNATVTDDGRPAATIQTRWRMVGGPGPVLFADPLAIDTTATFASIGIYELELSASDSDSISSDKVIIDVRYVPDSDDDGVHDEHDTSPNDPTDSDDTDGDSVGDNTDDLPDDPTDSDDTDGDSVGDNTDDLPDNPTDSEDTVGDITDTLPNEPTQSNETTQDIDSEATEPAEAQESDATPRQESVDEDAGGSGLGVLTILCLVAASTANSRGRRRRSLTLAAGAWSFGNRSGARID